MLAELKAIHFSDSETTNRIQLTSLTVDEIVYYFNVHCMPTKYESHYNTIPLGKFNKKSTKTL